MLDEKSIRERMQKSVDAVRRDLAKIRTGIASPSILDNVFIDYYGKLIKKISTNGSPTQRVVYIENGIAYRTKDY